MGKKQQPSNSVLRRSGFPVGPGRRYSSANLLGVEWTRDRVQSNHRSCNNAPRENRRRSTETRQTRQASLRVAARPLFKNESSGDPPQRQDNRKGRESGPIGKDDGALFDG